MNQYKVKITPYALEQMKEIRDYIKFQLLNPDAARDLLQEMQKKINELSYKADSIKKIEDQPWGSQGVRKIIVKNFYLYFWINTEDETVHVIAVTYAKRNQKKVLDQIEDME